MTRRHLMVMFIAPLVGLLVGRSNAHAQTRLPSSVLDLTDWKLTLPVEAPGSETAREVKRPELHSFSDRFFRVHVDPTGSGVVFTAPVEGATLPGRATHCSELREMTNGGTGNASWSSDRRCAHHSPSMRPSRNSPRPSRRSSVPRCGGRRPI